MQVSEGALTSGNDGRLSGTGAIVVERAARIEGEEGMLRKKAKIRMRRQENAASVQVQEHRDLEFWEGWKFRGVKMNPEK